MSKLQLTTEGDTTVIVTRRFDATPEELYRAHTDPELLRQWLLGPEGWSMTVCVHESKPGGKIRFEWTDGKGGDFYLTGEVLEVDPPHRFVHVERMHMPDPTPDNRVVTTFTKDGDGTLLTLRMSLPDAATRKAMLASGMEHGMEASYQRLERTPGWRSAAKARPTVHVSIDVPDLEAGLRFYGAVFGFEERMRPFPSMAIVDANNVTVCMHEKAAGSKSSAGGDEMRRYERHWTPVHLDLHVTDFDDVLERVRAAGGHIENEFRTEGPQPAAFCSDPFGNGFCVIGEAA